MQDTVGPALDTWADYVVAQKAKITLLPAGSEQNGAALALQAKERKVIAALTAYQAASELALRGVNPAQAGTIPAPAALVAAVADFIAVAKAQAN